MHLPIGISDFRKLIEYRDPLNNGYIYVDKTAFIKEIIYDAKEVIVVTRPRRFGKTLNLSMLRYFFAETVEGKPTQGLFDTLEISKELDCMPYQGQFPVIFITFKDAKYHTFDLCYEHIKEQIAEIYTEYEWLLTSEKLSTTDRAKFKSILKMNATTTRLDASIKYLSKLIYKVTGKHSIILIDEYDTPIQEAYLHGYYDQLIEFIRNLFSSGLKDNNFLHKAILTGILRVSKESLFSGLNHVEIYSVLDKNYSKYFGFTTEETSNLLTKTQLPANLQQTKEWYNGYNFGGTTIYNPWSIIKFIAGNGDIKSHWVNTSGNGLIKKLITRTSSNLQNYLTLLIKGESIKEYIDEHVVFNDLMKHTTSIWSLLLMSGYITYTTCQYIGSRAICELKIPNNEVKDFYITTIEEWFTDELGLAWYQGFLSNLTNGLIIEFEEKLQTWIERTYSFHDLNSTTTENFYHVIILTLTAGLIGTHIIESNRESGSGRFDISITPIDLTKLGIIIEFKLAETLPELEKQAIFAFNQIKKRNYIASLESKGIKKICRMGISFFGKKIKIVSDQII